MSKNSDKKDKTESVDGNAVFPTVSMGENPSNGHNSAYLHPCETAKWIAKLQEEASTIGDGVKYLESFIMLCSAVVEMRPGSRGGLGQSNKVSSLKSGDNGKDGIDMQIVTTPFADLIKRLPNVKVSSTIYYSSLLPSALLTSDHLSLSDSSPPVGRRGRTSSGDDKGSFARAAEPSRRNFQVALWSIEKHSHPPTPLSAFKFPPSERFFLFFSLFYTSLRLFSTLEQ